MSLSGTAATEAFRRLSLPWDGTSPLTARLPWNGKVPKGRVENLRFRQAAIKAGSEDATVAVGLRNMCAADPCFFVNVFGWCYDPRLASRKEDILILWPFQEALLCELVAAGGMLFGQEPHDTLTKKSRDEGGTIIHIWADLWAFCFERNFTAGWTSRKEELVECPGDPKALFSKAMHALEHMPSWITGEYEHSRQRHLVNKTTRSTIDGETSTPDVFTGDRRTTVLADEYALIDKAKRVAQALHDVSRSVRYNSTSNGGGTWFRHLETGTDIRKFYLHWALDPRKNAGLYRAEGGRPVFYDPDYYAAPGRAFYPFNLDGKVRSPWYDAEEKRRGSRHEMASQIDMDDAASGSPYYDIEVLERIKREDCCEPFVTGELRFDAFGVPTGFDERSDGRLRLWVNLVGGRPPKGQYVEGVDVSGGGDQSNSVASVADAVTHRKVGELATINLWPHEFALYAAALGRWFPDVAGEALMGWEKNGPGGTFGRVVVYTCGYSRVWMRRDRDDLVPDITTKPGWAAGRQSKEDLHGSYRSDLATGRFINPSLEAVEECKNYVYLATGGVGYQGVDDSDDATGAKDNHGDRPTADAIAAMLIEGAVVEEPRFAEVEDAPWNSIRGRLESRMATSRNLL